MFAHPLPEGHRFPMLKYELIPEQLLYEGSIEQEQLFEPGLLEEEIIVMTHEKAYWEKLRDLTLSDREQRRIGFPLSPELVEREVRIARGTIEAAISAMEYKIAFNVAGGTHHAGRSWGEGFYVHQGNGTAEIFGKVPQVFTFSMHGDKNFPFRKEQSDLDVPLENGMGDEAYLQLLEQHLKKAFLVQQPDFVFYLSGVDVLATDKLGKLALSKAGCKERDRIVLQYCKDLGVPLQISMGGGYSADIKDIVDAHCNTFRLAADLFG
eukprot:gene17300-20640_t